jgi:hypothetical protein
MNAVVIVWLHLLVNKIMNNSKLEKLDFLHHKYKALEDLYYSLYIDSFSDVSLAANNFKFLKLYNNFKEVCRLLTIVKQLIENVQISMLGLREIKVLTNYKDIQNFLDNNDLYPLVYSNHDLW